MAINMSTFKSIVFILLQIIGTSSCVILCFRKTKEKIHLFNIFNYVNFFVKEVKENSNNENNIISINNSVKSNSNQLSSFEESGRYV